MPRQEQKKYQYTKSQWSDAWNCKYEKGADCEWFYAWQIGHFDNVPVVYMFSSLVTEKIYSAVLNSGKPFQAH